MAEAVVAISFISSIASLIDIISRTLSRLRESQTIPGQAPAVYQDVLDQLPLLLEVVQRLQSQSSDRSQHHDLQSKLSPAVDGCIRQINMIGAGVEKWRPSSQDSSIKRIRKAIASVNNEKKLVQALRILEMYKTTIHIYLSSSHGLIPAKPTLGIYDIPSSQLSHFVGREEMLQNISQSVQEAFINSSVPKALVLIGMGGQGKTQIALEYCRRAQASDTVEHIVWIDATTENAMVRSFSNIAERLTNLKSYFWTISPVSHTSNASLSRHRIAGYLYLTTLIDQT